MKYQLILIQTFCVINLEIAQNADVMWIVWKLLHKRIPSAQARHFAVLSQEPLLIEVFAEVHGFACGLLPIIMYLHLGFLCCIDIVLEHFLLSRAELLSANAIPKSGIDARMHQERRLQRAFFQRPVIRILKETILVFI